MARPKVLKGKVRRCSIVIEEELLQKVHAEAKKRSISASEAMREAIEKCFSEEAIHPPIKREALSDDQQASNRRVLRDAFGHLHNRVIGEHSVRITRDSIEFFRDESLEQRIITTEAGFESRVREFIAKAQKR